MKRIRHLLVCFHAALLPVIGVVPPSVAAEPAPTFDILVFTKAEKFVHPSIPDGTAAVAALGAKHGFSVTATDDAVAFTPGNLAGYEAVVFLNTTGDVLDSAQEAAFESYVRGGGGFMGVHSAADTEYEWPFYHELVGARFTSHPRQRNATVRVANRAHPATAHLSPTWQRFDEWHNFRSSVRRTSRVLATVDRGSHDGGTAGAGHPIAWCRDIDSGRSFYTGMGHVSDAYTDPSFRVHLLGGIRYAAGASHADCRPEVGYTPLYNGSTEGWTYTGRGTGFRDDNGTLTAAAGGQGLLWYSAKEFSSYSLRLDWKMSGDQNSGVYVGFDPPNSYPPTPRTHLEVQIDASDTPEHTTGAVYGFQAADIAARDAALNNPPDWNSYELLVQGERLRVFLNGVQINDFTNTDPVRSLASGYVGIQNHGPGVSFRNIRIKELDPAGPH